MPDQTTQFGEVAASAMRHNAEQADRIATHPTPTPTADAPAEPFSTYTFTDADGDTLIIGRAAFPVSGTPSVTICTECGVPVYVPFADVPTLIAALEQAAGITPATPGMTVYELRAAGADDPTPDLIATYSFINAATHHGEHCYRDRHGTAADLEWRQTGTDDAPAWHLVAVDDLDGEDTVTDWHIVAVTVPAVYVTEAGGDRG